ncbi:MAG: prepilin-type N-terminal cleavage/methylation domain-containing protein [Gammaproteobacteria bacterium]|nr:prepilin-type N-terminal cleavage/methylation domain-containing protein [Gammaproteobacteria bacterium]
MNNYRQSGFTLVEIAIVLVIVGLLLGGILKGQELINSARVRNIADQNSAVQAAYYGFIDRYRQVPGDMRQTDAQAAIGGTINAGGDGNGRIGGGTTADWVEASAAWEHLSKAGYMTGNYQGGGTSAETYQAPDVAPVNAFNGYVLISRLPAADYAGVGSERLGYVFGNQIPVNIMRELDVKLDDARPETGVVRAAADSGTAYDAVNAADAACVDDTPDPSIWDINTNSQDCNGVYLY